jgi:hypothetical protein
MNGRENFLGTPEDHLVRGSPPDGTMNLDESDLVGNAIGPSQQEPKERKGLRLRQNELYES